MWGYQLNCLNHRPDFFWEAEEEETIEETDREGSGKGKRYDGVIGSYGPFRRFEQI
jgi:hypothetical protein